MTPNFKLHPSKFELLKPATQQVTQQVRKLLAVCVGEAFEVISLRYGLAVSIFTLHLLNFHLAATIKKNFKELGV